MLVSDVLAKGGSLHILCVYRDNSESVYPHDPFSNTARERVVRLSLSLGRRAVVLSLSRSLARLLARVMGTGSLAPAPTHKGLNENSFP